MCIFCEIAAGRIPGAKVYEDDTVVAFLDLSQVTIGHTLIVPKEHYDTLTDCPAETAAKMINAAQIVARRQMKHLGANGFNILNNGYAAAGQTVMHAHMHVIPRYDENDQLHISFGTNEGTDLNKTASILSED